MGAALETGKAPALMRTDHLFGRFIGGLALLAAFWLVYGLVMLSKWVIAQF